ncbi:MAG: glycoside hydrolase family 2 protein [Ruminococcaceae bacterium]|nr:glycoside hydrolase family 2 protein [Oscillospiraceae bacterium]
MKKYCFNKDWEFKLENDLEAFNVFGFEKYAEAGGAGGRFYDYNNWDKIDLPHDWAVALPKDLRANTFAGARANSSFNRFMTEKRSKIDTVYNIGWYRKQFRMPEEWQGKRIFVEFEGVFRDATVFVNGSYMDRHTSGYTSFIVELTDHLYSDIDNSIAVRVDSEQPEGWWYEGSGIYRNVNILVGEPVYFKYNQTVIKTDIDGRVFVGTIVLNDSENEEKMPIICKIHDQKGRKVAETRRTVTVEPYSEKKVSLELKVDEPNLWSVDAAYLYTLKLKANNEEFTEKFGIRTVAFDTDKGFFLNGKPLKVRGACVHQDFGGVGVALSDNLNRYKIQRLKDMGVNAYRCAHHAPSPALLNACDELGMLVMDETRMFGTSAEAVRQLTDLIERDRNHPCVFIWSLGNEEFSIQNEPISASLMEKITRIAKSLDDTRSVTYGGNNGNKFLGANSVAEVRGINYIRSRAPWTDIYHEEHPNQPMIGTEESSYVLSRGGAVTDLGSGLLDSTGMVTMAWGQTPKGWVKYFEKRPYLAGSFMWTGFDYRGEPNPFVFSNVSSSFGTIDLCGMEKPPFYYYKAWWTDEPVLKLTPHWNHNEGDTVTMAVFTNCEEITLYINGRAIETKKVERFDAPMFTVEYEAGVISVEGIRNGVTYRDEVKTSDKTAEIRCVPVLVGNSDNDVSVYQFEAYDKNGVLCRLASNMLDITVENGAFVGVGNGDPACLDYEQKLPSEEAVYIRNFNCENGLYSIPLKIENYARRRFDYMECESAVEGFDNDYRNIAKFKDSLSEEREEVYTTTVTNVSEYQYIEFERFGGPTTVYLNGEEIGNNKRNGRISYASVRPYRFYCDFKEGNNEIKVVSVQDDFTSKPISGYVKIGKTVKDTTWNVRLHYGLARAFVKSATPEKIKITAKIKK